MTSTRPSTSPPRGQGASASSPRAATSPADTEAVPYESRVQIRHLKLIKWTDERGEIQRFSLMERVSLHWRDIGELVGLSFQQLECLAREHHGRHTDCCRAVLGSWLDDPPEEYPITWRGLIELLQDSELGQVVSELKNAWSKSNVK